MFYANFSQQNPRWVIRNSEKKDIFLLKNILKYVTPVDSKIIGILINNNNYSYYNNTFLIEL